jgi:hypothetical protein
MARLGAPAVLGVAIGLVPLLAAAQVDLAGLWEIQSMGADRQVEVKVQGAKLVAHRVMWPEFEGEKYKLEHLYRGVIKGGNITGQLLVKEEELPDFEVLRDFTGSIDGGGRFTLDGMPMKRKGGAPPTPAAEPSPKTPPPKPQERPSDSPDLAQATPPPPPPPPTAPPPAEGSAADPNASLFASIMGTPGASDLFQVSARIDIPDAAADLAEEGDSLYDKGDYAGALAKFEQASQEGGGQHVQLLHRKGRCQLKLKKYVEAKQLLGAALRLDPHSKAIKKDYQLAKKKVGKG